MNEQRISSTVRCPECIIRTMITSRGTHLLIAVASIAVIGLIVYAGAKLVCSHSFRSCAYGEACPDGSMCVDYGEGVKKCSAAFCASVQNVPKGAGMYVNRTKKKIGEWSGKPVTAASSAAASKEAQKKK